MIKMSRSIDQVVVRSFACSIRDFLPKEYTKMKNMEKRILLVRFSCSTNGWIEREIFLSLGT